VSCKKAIGVANTMKEKFDGKLNVKIYTLDSEEAKPYALEFKGSTNVLLNNEWVPLNIAIEAGKMEAFLSPHL
jgi:hypothetical protein